MPFSAAIRRTTGDSSTPDWPFRLAGWDRGKLGRGLARSRQLRGRVGRRSGDGPAPCAGLADPGERGSHRNRVPFVNQDLEQDAVVGARYLGLHLSVDTPNSGSSKATGSPTCFSHWETTPSVTSRPASAS